MKIWRIDYNDSTYTDALMQNLPLFRGLKFFRGASLKEHFPNNATVEIRTKRSPTDSFRAGSFWIVSTKLRKILETHEVDAEYFPLQVVDKKGNKLEGTWWCFNPKLVVDWFDWSRSKYLFEQGFATEITAVHVNEEVLSGVPLAVAARTIPVLVAVSDGLAAAVVENGCTGIVFCEPHKWSPK